MYRSNEDIIKNHADVGLSVINSLKLLEMKPFLTINYEELGNEYVLIKKEGEF